MVKWYKIPGKMLRGIVLALYAQPLLTRVFNLLQSWGASFFFLTFFTRKKK